MMSSRQPASIAAIFGCTYSTIFLLIVGIAAACAGGGGEECGFAKPSVTTKAATNVSYTGAELHGTVNPNNCETEYIFELGTEKGKYSVITGHSAGSGNETVSVTRFTSGTMGTTYHYRVSATNINGTTYGEDQEFTLLSKEPTATTGAATGVTEGTATLHGTVNPMGGSTVYYFEYGLTEEYGQTSETTGAGSVDADQNVSHGVSKLEAGTEYHYRLVASNGKGIAKGSDKTFTTAGSLPWEITETLNPEGVDDSYLYDISCEPSMSACTAVGKSTSSGVDSPLAHRWNGTSWSAQAPAKKSGFPNNRLRGVDCPSETRCIAVGNFQGSEGGPATFAQLWNEGKWSNQTTPVPEEATSSEYVAVGCNSTANCTAVGSAVIGGVKTAIAARWNSPTWTSSSVPIPEGATSSQLDGVDCIWSNFCMAVGRYTDSEGSIKSLLEFWNGTEWELKTLTDPEEAVQSTLLDVSCTPSPSRCTAVGGWKNSKLNQFTLAYRFNGSTWSLQSTPNPAESIASVFQEVSCATETSCTAAGSWVSGAGGSNQTLAEEWDGSNWSIQGTPNPAGAVFSAFFGVSCQESGCLGVGYSTDESGDASTLGEIRE